MAPDAQIECEIGAAGYLRPIVVYRLEPAQRALHKTDRRHQDAQRPEIKGLQDAENETHIVVMWDPADIGRVSRIAKGIADHL